MAFNAIPQGGIINFYESVPFDRQHSHVRDFLNEQERTAYFEEKKLVAINGVSYIRNDSFKVQLPVAQLKYCNYCSFVNEGFDFKKYYAFITDIKYINNETTEVTITIDNWQTWLFQYDILPCWVEREHVLDDTYGKHTIPESLPISDYIEQNTYEYFFNNWYVGIVYAPNSYISQFTYDGGSIIENQYSGATVEYILLSDVEAINAKIRSISNTGQIVINVYMIPFEFINKNETNIIYPVIYNSNVPFKYRNDEYIPKNNKTCIYPYKVLRVYNGREYMDYKFEEFGTSEVPESPSFTIISNYANSVSCSIYPRDYRISNFQLQSNSNIGYTQSLTISDFPICSWTENTFQQYMTIGQIGEMINTLSIPTSLVSGNSKRDTSGSDFIQGTELGINKVQNYLSAAFTPLQVKGNLHSGYLTTANNMIGFVFYGLSIKPEYARMIDNFFTLYGYRVNEWKKPNLRGRTLFNYVKTIDATISGNIPQFAIEDFESWFNNGITIWHTEIGTEGDNDIE